MWHLVPWWLFGMVLRLGLLAAGAFWFARLVRRAKRRIERRESAPAVDDPASRLPDALRRRVRALRAKAADIRRELSDPNHLDAALYGAELGKVDELVGRFAALALDVHRAKRHLEEADVEARRGRRAPTLDALAAAVEARERELFALEESVLFVGDRLALRRLASPGAAVELDELVTSLDAVGEALQNAEPSRASEPRAGRAPLGPGLSVR